MRSRITAIVLFILGALMILTVVADVPHESFIVIGGTVVVFVTSIYLLMEKERK